MRLLAIDPGTTESAYVEYDTEQRRVVSWAKLPNAEMLRRIDESWSKAFACEMIQSYGMSVGREIFETVLWVGRFCERWEHMSDREPARLVFRREVKIHLCNSVKAKDANVRQALIDRYGGKAQAIGLKATQGPLYGLSGDGWAALGVAVTAAETPEAR